MPNTPDGWPYPAPGDAPAGHEQMRDLAEALDERTVGLTQVGTRGFGTLGAGSATSLPIVFPVPFDAAPVVLVSTDSAPKVAGSALNITPAGFDLHVVNTDTVGRATVGQWAAFGARVTMP